MPVRGMNRARLREHIRKYSPVYIVGCIVCMLLTNILYTSTRYQVPYEKEFLVYLLDSYTNIEPLEEIREDALQYGQSIDDTLEAVVFESILYSDPAEDYTSSYLLMARAALGNGDIYIASSIGAQSLFSMGLAKPLEEALDSGWMEGLGLEPVMCENEETGETFIGGLSLDHLHALLDLGVMNNEGAVLVVASNSGNEETSMAVIEHIVQALEELENAPAEG